MRTIDSFVKANFPMTTKIWGSFYELKTGKIISSAWNFDNEERFISFVRGLAKHEKDKYGYKGFHDEERTELWRKVENLYEV